MNCLAEKKASGLTLMINLQSIKVSWEKRKVSNFCLCTHRAEREWTIENQREFYILRPFSHSHPIDLSQFPILTDNLSRVYFLGREFDESRHKEDWPFRVSVGWLRNETEDKLSVLSNERRSKAIEAVAKVNRERERTNLRFFRWIIY